MVISSYTAAVEKGAMNQDTPRAPVDFFTTELSNTARVEVANDTRA
jgi:hypothetical protein